MQNMIPKVTALIKEQIISCDASTQTDNQEAERKSCKISALKWITSLKLNLKTENTSP